MADREELLRLASLCEEASAEDQLKALAEAILAVVTDDAFGERLYDLLEVGALLDAAVALVPEGWTYTIRPRFAEVRHPKLRERDTCSTAATPALALAAASLRARAQDPLRAHGGGE